VNVSQLLQVVFGNESDCEVTDWMLVGLCCSAKRSDC